ncbi:hypothetical protein W97_00875 [Coniosporium apollinis CBS 100218]|uniref:F-type H+-transporting ATPase subunit epsilon n=1 Tax=Coniosporium apollinis (strain CBS 100218) TaxID=1168221 RepID=R7YIQ0_CONA1|nr:uncharacterized protein W97_00875 [Coniosporium apollinis CBS 100218]EON61659.1 hypothetical protein W97_00875 [Coniosporium apollinis CBS 100218]
MAFAWKAAGLTYNRYLAVAARVVRRSLKEDKRLQAERRGEMDLRFAKWEVSRGLGWGRPEERRCNLGEIVLRDILFLLWPDRVSQRWQNGADDGGQNGKQGENKSLASANEAAMAEHAGGQGQ